MPKSEDFCFVVEQVDVTGVCAKQKTETGWTKTWSDVWRFEPLFLETKNLMPTLF